MNNTPLNDFLKLLAKRGEKTTLLYIKTVSEVTDGLEYAFPFYILFLPTQAPWLNIPFPTYSSSNMVSSKHMHVL